MKIAWWLERGIGMTKRERANRALEAATRKAAYLLPRKLAYWCAIRVMVNATTGEHSNQIVPELKAMEALERWS